MKSTRILSLLVTAFSTTLQPVSAVKWKFDSAKVTCDDSGDAVDPFTHVVITGKCTQKYGSTEHTVQCKIGDTPDITGRLTATRAFSNNQVVVKPCLSGYCSKSDMRVDGRVCDWIVPIEDQDCGEAGAYQFDYSMMLPDNVPTGMGWLFNKLTVNVHVEDSECNETKDERYRMPNPIVSFGVVAGFAAALCREKRRRRREEDDDDDDDDDETYYDEESYVEMGSPIASGRSKLKSSRAHLDNLPEDDIAQHPVRNTSSQRHYNAKEEDDTSQLTEQSSKHEGQQEYKPPLVVNIPEDVLSQSPKKTSSKSPQEKTEISLQVLRQWYGEHGVAIV